MTTTKNNATLLELKSQIAQFSEIVKSSHGLEKDLFIKLLNGAESDLKTKNYN